jgi:flagellar export protein FliJ
MARFRLASVLRARQVQEDSARAQVLRARAEAAKASTEAAYLERSLTGVTPPPQFANPNAFIATLCARQGLAADISAARALAAQAGEAVDERIADFTAASVRRAGVEKMAERHATATRAAEEAASQRELDDLTSARHGLTRRLPGE